MYQILIVDDDRPELEVIRFLLDKYNFSLHITEATDGKKALALLQQQPFDILFTDIKMPFLDGLALSAKARLIYPDMHIVFFSGYDDFEYIKEAFSLRVVNYILKPVNPEEFQKTISSVIQSIEQSRIEASKQEAALYFAKNHILYQLINKNNIEALMRQHPHLDFGFAYRYHRLFLIQTERDYFGSFPDQIEQSLPKDSDFINLNPSQSLLLFSGKEQDFEWYRNKASALRGKINELCNMDCYIAISNPFSNPEQIAEAYEEAERLLEDRFFFVNQFWFADSAADDKNPDAKQDVDAILSRIEKDIQFKDTFAMKQDVNMLLMAFGSKASYSHLYVRFLSTRLLQMLLKYLPESSDKSINNHIAQIFSTRHFSEIQAGISEIVDTLAGILEQERESPRHAIHLVKQYIHRHYGEDLGLNLLAEKVYLTPRYLSAMFIQQTGCGLSKYIKNVRMEKAQDLLVNTNMKITDISKHVGYSNVSYFCKSFLEDFGTTPEKYRQRKNAVAEQSG